MRQDGVEEAARGLDLTLALLTGMSVRTVSAKVVANLGWDKVKATHPVFAGDTLYAESTVLHKRESRSRPTQGIVAVFTRGINQDGVEVRRSSEPCSSIDAATRPKSRQLLSSRMIRRPGAGCRFARPIDFVPPERCRLELVFGPGVS